MPLSRARDLPTIALRAVSRGLASVVVRSGLTSVVTCSQIVVQAAATSLAGVVSV